MVNPSHIQKQIDWKGRLVGLGTKSGPVFFLIQPHVRISYEGGGGGGSILCKAHINFLLIAKSTEPLCVRAQLVPAMRRCEDTYHTRVFVPLAEIETDIELTSLWEAPQIISAG